MQYPADYSWAMIKIMKFLVSILMRSVLGSLYNLHSWHGLATTGMMIACLRMRILIARDRGRALHYIYTSAITLALHYTFLFCHKHVIISL